MIVNCPQCRQRLRARDDQPGATLRCPACRTEFRPVSPRPRAAQAAPAKTSGMVAVVLAALCLGGVGFYLWQQERDAQARREAEQAAQRFMEAMEHLMRNDDPAAGVRRQLDNSPADGYGRPRPGVRVYYDAAGNPVGYSRDGK